MKISPKFKIDLVLKIKAINLVRARPDEKAWGVPLDGVPALKIFKDTQKIFFTLPN